MSDLMKRAHELAPFVAEALREVADEATVPDGDERDWTERQKASRDFAVNLAKYLLAQNDEAFAAYMAPTLLAHAEAARDVEVSDD